MTNKLQGKGRVIQYTNNTGADIASGQPVLLGDQGLRGVAVQAIANGAAGSVEIPECAIYSISVRGHNGAANAAVDAFDKVYLTAGENFVDVDTAQVFFGFTLEAQTSGGTSAKPVAVFGPIA